LYSLEQFRLCKSHKQKWCMLQFDGTEIPA